MKTKIHKGNNEYSGHYYQGVIYIVQGRLKGSWREVTSRFPTEFEAKLDLEDFIESTRVENETVES